MHHNSTFEKAQKLANKFAEVEGRRPRVMIVSSDDVQNTNAVVSNFADIGFDVDLAPLIQTPVALAKQAVENDVHFIGILNLKSENKKGIHQLINELSELESTNIIVFEEGIISEVAITIMETYLTQK